MTDPDEYYSKLGEIVEKDPRYDIEAYLFVQEALTFLIGELGRQRHVTGKELLEGIRRYALKEYGPLSRVVLEHWGVRRCGDFGEIVFNMVDKKLLGKTERDSKEDFADGYDFEEAFDKPFDPTSSEGK